MKPECITYPNGDKYWTLNGRHYHREDGPAVELSSGAKYWYRHDLLHRDDGPAVEYSKDFWLDGHSTEYWINGELITQLNDKHIYGKEKLAKLLVLI